MMQSISSGVLKGVREDLTGLARLQEVFKTETGVSIFRQWAEHDMTRLLLEAARELARMRASGEPPNGSGCAYALGGMLRSLEILDFLESGAGVRSLGKGLRMPEATYAVRDATKGGVV